MLKWFQIDFSQKTLIQVTDSKPWVRCASGNVCKAPSDLYTCMYLCERMCSNVGFVKQILNVYLFPNSNWCHKIKVHLNRQKWISNYNTDLGVNNFFFQILSFWDQTVGIEVIFFDILQKCKIFTIFHKSDTSWFAKSWDDISIAVLYRSSCQWWGGVELWLILIVFTLIVFYMLEGLR